ncbi:MAG TPA: hypothetical protein DIT07_11635 [Sphingobacteriaceae bacterium]|nr:hypothetical protein [Sphingobacteriaceae bacterium]
MAKSNYLFKFLSGAAVFFYSYAGGADVDREGTKKEQGQIYVPVSSDADRRRLIKSVYDAEEGVRETGKNSGKRVEEYLHYVNLKKGEPWCAAFVCWVFGRAYIANPASGWSPDLFPKGKVIWQRSALAKYQSRFPKTGDVFGIWFPEKKRIAHVGFVDQWNDTWLITVEGNTNEAGSREGDGVYRKRRLVRSVYQVASYVIK